MSDKYDDCASCAFGGQDHAICDSCDEGDQWEPGFEDEGSAELTKISVIKIVRKPKATAVEEEKMAA